MLIPRPETEILLDKACAFLKQHRLEGKVAWDLCTGSGCLGIGLKKALPQLDVIISDFSEKALEIARGNAKRNTVLVETRQGDLLTVFKRQKADIILCNPPYVSDEEYNALDPCVRDFEPKEALVAGHDGLVFYRRLSRQLSHYLNSGALLFFEIGTGQGKAVKDLFSAPCWHNISIEKDWAGHERFFFLEFQ